MAPTPAQLDDEIKVMLDRKLIAEWGGGKKDRPGVAYGTPLYWALAREDQRKKVAARVAKAKRDPAKPTDLNMWVLGRVAHGRREFPNRISAVSSPHVRRCMKAGWVVALNKQRLRLTDAGFTALADAVITGRGDFLMPDGSYTDEVFE
jgi:hypothetical protein